MCHHLKDAMKAGLSLTLSLILVLGLFAGSANAQPPSRVLQLGEELTYNVRYGPFDLGQIRIRTLNRIADGKYLVYYAKALIDSYPKVPFVELHATFESMIDTTIYSHKFIGKMKQDNVWDFSRYTFDYDKKSALIERGSQDTVVAKRETMPLDRVFQDGLSLFFFARNQLFAGKTVDAPVLINEQKSNARINFTGGHETVEVDAIEYPVDVVRFDGTADFVGVYGVTGDFEGWFSNDDARVPIKAKMKVILGSADEVETGRLGSTACEVVESMPTFPHHGVVPSIDPSAFIADGAIIVGDVTIGREAGIWFNAVLRGDINSIAIGERSNVQDGVVAHVTKALPVIVGSEVTVGHMAMIHGCVIGDWVLIGMGAVVLDRAVVESDAIVAAGAVVREGFRVPSGVLVAGVPAKIIRDITPEERTFLRTSADNYVGYAKTYR